MLLPEYSHNGGAGTLQLWFLRGLLCLAFSKDLLRFRAIPAAVE